MAMGLGCYRLLQRCSILPITELMGIIWWPLRLVFRPLRQAGLHSAASLLARRVMDSVWQSDSVWWDLCISRMVHDSLTLSAQVFGGVSTFFWSKAAWLTIAHSFLRLALYRSSPLITLDIINYIASSGITCHQWSLLVVTNRHLSICHSLSSFSITSHRHSLSLITTCHHLSSRGGIRKIFVVCVFEINVCFCSLGFVGEQRPPFVFDFLGASPQQAWPCRVVFTSYKSQLLDKRVPSVCVWCRHTGPICSYLQTESFLPHVDDCDATYIDGS